MSMPIEEQAEYQRAWHISQLEDLIKESPEQDAKKLFQIELNLVKTMPLSQIITIMESGNYSSWFETEAIRIWRANTEDSKNNISNQLTCSKCGYTWTPRIQKPKKCPRCHQHRAKTTVGHH